MRIEEEQEQEKAMATEFEVYPIYTGAEIESLEVQMNAYIATRDNVYSDATWKQHKKISASLLAAIDDLNRLKVEYTEMRDKLTGASGGKIDYETVNEDYYKCQDRVYRAIMVISDFRKELAKILD